MADEMADGIQRNIVKKEEISVKSDGDVFNGRMSLNNAPYNGGVSNHGKDVHPYGSALENKHFQASNGTVQGGSAMQRLSSYNEMLTSAFIPTQNKCTANRYYPANSHQVSRIWNGELLPRTYRSPIFSCKLFVGGVPWDITEHTIIKEFGKYGECHVEWPSKEVNFALKSRSSTKRIKATGFVYVVFENEKSVKNLMKDCSNEIGTAGESYFRLKVQRNQVNELRQIGESKWISSWKRFCANKVDKNEITNNSSSVLWISVQVIPWVISDNSYNRRQPNVSESKLTVFVGGLHGMLTAEVLFSIMSDVYDDVISVELDTDKYKYPIGSGRVMFSSQTSFFHAIESEFLEIRTSKFVKKIQIDPYIEDSGCSQCNNAQGPYFCRNRSCFSYFCLQCWQVRHAVIPPCDSHKALIRKSRRSSRFDAFSNAVRNEFVLNTYQKIASRNNTSPLVYACGLYPQFVYNTTQGLTNLIIPSRYPTEKYASPLLSFQLSSTRSLMSGQAQYDKCTDMPLRVHGKDTCLNERLLSWRAISNATVVEMNDSDTSNSSNCENVADDCTNVVAKHASTASSLSSLRSENVDSPTKIPNTNRASF